MFQIVIQYKSIFKKSTGFIFAMIMQIGVSIGFSRILLKDKGILLFWY